MKRLLILTLLLGLLSCSKDPSLWKINNLENGSIRVMGHGGMGEKYRYPMDSYESLSEVLKLDVYGTEMDVQMTKDSVLVLYHHAKLENGTGCNGKIRDKNWNEIKSCRYKQPYSKKTYVISAEEFFHTHGAGKYYFSFDCKVETDDDEIYVKTFVNKLVELSQKHRLIQRCLIESYNTSFLKELYARDSSFKLFIHADTYADALGVNRQVKLFGMVMDKERISAGEIKAAHSLGLRVALFNAASRRQNLDAIALSPDYIQSDNCPYLIEALRE